MEYEPEIFVNVGCAIIMKKGENGENLILLIRRSKGDSWSGMYEPPRGKSNGKEKIETCTRREAKEESGLDIEIIRFIDKFEYLADNGKRKSTQYNFLCKMKDESQQIKLSKEHDDYRWISSVGEAEILVAPEMKKTISKVLNPDQQIVSYQSKIVQTIEEYLKKIQK